MRALRMGVLTGLLAVAATTGTAAANHGICAAAGGYPIDHLGPTGADLCVSVKSDGARVGTDTINDCTFTGGCPTVGAHVEVVGGRPSACVGSALDAAPVLAVCAIQP